ncbi:MAG: hypothetical protein WBH31_14415 [Promethearchaeia archaeon]
MEKCEVTPVRSDEISKPGLITNDMMDAIINWDMCIAVLAFNNRNVYYELAIAHAANKPVILLKHRHENIPFDIKDLKYIEYDLEDTEKIKEDFYVNEIIKFTNSIQASNWNVSGSISGLDLITPRKDIDKYQYFEKSESYGKWVDILNDTDKIFYIMGVSLNAWIATQNLAGDLVKKAKNGCKIKILLLHKDNPALSDLINDEISQIKRERFFYMMDYNWKKYAEIAENNKNIEVRRLKEGTMTHSKYINDNYGFYIPYFYSKISNTTPLWKCKQGTYLYKVLLEDFELLWNLSE